MLENNAILLGKTVENQPSYLLAKQINRHGLIAGATGTGKTVTLKVIAESLSNMGVPVFMADVKGDLSGCCKVGETNENIGKRVQELGLENFANCSFPVHFFDLYQKKGHPVRTTISQMGPTLLARILGLSDVQEGVLNSVFRIADDSKLLLIDIKDLRSMLQYVSDHHDDYKKDYGNMSSQSIGAILRSLLTLEDNGGDLFFGEPEMDFNDWMSTDENGKGYINILDSTQLVQNPLLYSTFLLWMLNELFENLPEVGDLDKPKLVFFFDEAHLLFDDTPKALVQKVEQVVKLIRSKGVGVYFITQNPTDLPDSVLAQCSNRIVHALRAYTPAETKKVKATCDTFRPNDKFDTQEAIMALKTGQALVSCLDEEGTPTIVEQVVICPPQSSMNAIDDLRRNAQINASDLYGKYEQVVDRESAYEELEEIEAQEAEEEAIEQEARAKEKQSRQTRSRRGVMERATSNAISTLTRETSKDIMASLTGKKRRSHKSPLEKAANSILSTLSSEVGRDFSRGLFGILKR